MGQRKKKTQKKKEACLFCGRDEDDEIVFGKFFHDKDLSIHQNCMFLSSGLAQRGSKESEGILGFLPVDIKEEYARGQKLNCCYCRQGGATLGCVVNSCKRSFHLPCGVKNLALNQHFGDFSSYCHAHKLKQKHIQIKEDLYCYICCSELTPDDLENCLYSPCCKKNWFHHYCLQKYAISAGQHFFKCPLCNNSSTFVEEMKVYGVCIPNKDASWELESNAFNELLYRPKCGASECSCYRGREHDGKGSWSLLACAVCGADATHKHCGNLKKSDKIWRCDDCQAFETARKKKEDSIINDSKNVAVATLNFNGESLIESKNNVVSNDDNTSLHQESVSVATSSGDDKTIKTNVNVDFRKDETTNEVKNNSPIEVRYKLRSFSIVLNKVDVKSTKLESAKTFNERGDDANRLKCESKSNCISSDKSSVSFTNKGCESVLSSETIVLNEVAVAVESTKLESAKTINKQGDDANRLECESKSNCISSDKSSVTFKDEGCESVLSLETKLSIDSDKCSTIVDNLTILSHNDKNLFKDPSESEKNVSHMVYDHVNDTGLLKDKSVKEFSLRDKGLKILGDFKTENSEMRPRKMKCLRDRNEIVKNRIEKSQPVILVKRQAVSILKPVKPKRRKIIGNGCCSGGDSHCIKKMFGISCENCK
ncbi:G2/M phase-specific E3 ubiquitin-protein ligase-like [Parasteatoda tepidariorum]|uniref:G2/M phase-specific E3 ubiquitin-protein ligase-like n=1 Tax=Parasteatoda tepidariorum TaxID=114398 RepID=UPI001C71F53A|nr:G2/M phase-specific E3 ubiquitin-protein ligase-like [Parasteatoda tepidariorum]